MYLNFDFFEHISQPNIYIGNPNRKIIKPLIGIRNARLKVSLFDIWEIDFEVDKYYDNRKLNPIYEQITHSMEVHVDTIGWFRINSYPVEHYDTNGRIYKTFTAYGYETTLIDIDIVGIDINCGTETSVEMYDENLDSLGIPKHNIQLYIKEANDDPTSDSYWKLGLLNILEHEYLTKKGWSIGDIDIAVSGLRGRQFMIDNQNVYSFLTQDAAASYKCLFWFDRVNKKINATKLENLGGDMNLCLSLRNVINSITITDKNEEYYTRFRVAGADNESTLLAYINYGSDRLENLDYAINTGKMDSALSEKYQKYVEFRESHREDYAEYSRTDMNLQEERTVYYELVPIQEVEIMFTNLTDEELDVELQNYHEILNTLLEVYGSEEAIEGTTDYSLYVSVRDVIIPKIELEKQARAEGGHAEKDEIDWKTNWELYGINELENKLTAYQSQVDVLEEKGYNVPWDETMEETNQDFHTRQYELYQQYLIYIDEINARLTILKEKVRVLDEDIKTNNTAQKDLATQAKLEHEQWGLTDQELSDIYALYRDTDYEDQTIEILDTDSIDDIINLAWQLYESAKEEIEIESHPQLSYEISLDNLFHIGKFSKKANEISMGDFCFLELDDGFTTKQRVIGMEFELYNFSDTSMQIEFSDMVTVCGKADDYRFLLEGNGSSQKNKLSRSMTNYLQGIASTTASQIAAKYLNGGSVFPNGISAEDQIKLQEALNGLVSGNLSLNELRVKLAKIDRLEADCAFVNYLEAKFLVANQAQFTELEAKVATIDDLLAGTVSAETAHIIKLTADNVTIDEAVIKDLIAKKILVSDLQAGDITISENMRILSENGMMIMNGETLQILGTNADGEQYVAIQLGYDAENKPSLIICDENGAVMLDAEGIHENIVPNGLIKNDMIADGTISKDKFNFSVVEENEDGSIDVAEVYVNGEGIYSKYVTIQDDVTQLSTGLEQQKTEVSGVKSEVDAANKAIKDEVWRDTIVDVVDENGNTVQSTIQTTLVQHSMDINGLRSTVKEIQTGNNPEFDSLTERVSTLEQNANGFKQEVKETYLARSDLDVSARNLLRNSKTLIYDDYSISTIS